MFEFDLFVACIIMLVVILPIMKCFTSPLYKEYKKNHPHEF